MKEIVDRKYFKDSLKLLYWSSLLIALLVAFSSVLGIVSQERIYPSEDLLQSFVPNDFVNLIAGLPLLLISIWLARRGKLIGLLSWPGALFYMIYVYFPYLFCVPFDVLFIPYLIIFSLSIYTLITLIVRIDGKEVSAHLSGLVPAKISGSILMGLSVLIIIRQAFLMINALVNHTVIGPQDLAIWIDDFSMASPAMFIGGFLLFKKRQFGYVVGTGLFLVYGILSLGLIPFLLIQSHLKDSSIDLMAIVILMIMAAICLIPFSYFVRGANSKNTKNRGIHE